MNKQYEFVAKLILESFFDERRDNTTLSQNHKDPELKEAYALLADMYDAIIVTVQKHMADHS